LLYLPISHAPVIAGGPCMRLLGLALPRLELDSNIKNRKLESNSNFGWLMLEASPGSNANQEDAE